MSETVKGEPDHTPVYKSYGGKVTYTAKAIRCGDRLVMVIAGEFIQNWGLKEGDWVNVNLQYVGPLEEKLAMLPDWLRKLAEEEGGRLPDMLLLPSGSPRDLEKWLQELSWLPEQIKEEARERGELPKALIKMHDGRMIARW